MRFILLLIAVCLVTPLAVAPAHAERAGNNAASPGAATWREWNAGLKEAGARNRPVVVDVYTEWCGWCKRMDRDVYSRPEIRAYLNNHFVMVKMDAESPAGALYDGQAFTQRALAARFRVTGYPTTIFLRSGGEHIFNVPGYLPPDQFMLVLRYIGDGHQARGVQWDDYVNRASGTSGAR